MAGMEEGKTIPVTLKNLLLLFLLQLSVFQGNFSMAGIEEGKTILYSIVIYRSIPSSLA